MYLAGDITEDFKYDPWRSDVYALGMTLMDVACLKLGQKTSKSEKLQEVNATYGEDFAGFMELILEEDAAKRCDFLELASHPVYLGLSANKKEEKASIPEERKTDSVSKATPVKTSEKLYNFIEKLPKNSSKIGKFYKILTEIKNVEEMNQVSKQPKHQPESENEIIEKVPQNYFKYFDCQ